MSMEPPPEKRPRTSSEEGTLSLSELTLHGDLHATLTQGQPLCDCASRSAEGFLACRGCGERVAPLRSVIGPSELLPAEYGGKSSGRALRVCATCMCADAVSLLPLPAHARVAGLTCGCARPAAGYRIQCYRLGVGSAGLIVYEDSVIATVAGAQPAVAPPDAAVAVRHAPDMRALHELVAENAATDRLLVVQGGAGWCPFSRRVEEMLREMGEVRSRASAPTCSRATRRAHRLVPPPSALLSRGLPTHQLTVVTTRRM
jgi:hypothetical protein